MNPHVCLFTRLLTSHPVGLSLFPIKSGMLDFQDPIGVLFYTLNYKDQTLCCGPTSTCLTSWAG